MLFVRKYTFPVFAVLITKTTAVNFHQNKLEGEEREIIHAMNYHHKRGVLKTAGEAIGRKIAQLSKTVEELANRQRASSVLKADAKFIRQKGVFEKHGGIDRAENDFLLMNVQDLEMQAVNRFCIIKQGIVGAGKVRFMRCKGKPSMIVYNKNTSKRKGSTIQVLYNN